MSEPVAGDRFDQYELQELLARSGMAAIFKARDTFSGATVALKIPHFQYESDVVFSERFRREEEVGQKLEHPGIVRILKPREKSRSYLAMEYIEGRSLRAMMGKSPMPRDQALAIARQVADALAYLEAHEIVHRDIKPENILVTAGGHVKIIDFGIALFQAERRMTWAGLSNTIGTPDYMAPEQIRGRRGDARTDVYALGMLLYELLTAHLPYDGPNARALLRAKTSEEPRPPSYWVPGFDPHLESIILRALERDPRNRYSGAAEMLRDLQDPSAVPPRDPQTGERRRRAGAARRRRVVAAAVVAVLVAVLLALVWIQGRSAAGSVPPAASALQGR
jgi:serine/threonine-protein kinase